MPTSPSEFSRPDAPSVADDHSTSLSLRAEGQDEPSHSNGRGPGHHLSVGASETADEVSMREFYSQLVTLLTQENTSQPKKANRNNLLVTLRRRWFPALLVSALAFVGFIYLLRPRQSIYQATVPLLLPPPPAVGGTQDPFAPPEAAYDIESEMAIIESEEVVKDAVSRLPNSLKVRGWGSKDIKMVGVDAVSYGSPSLVNINVSSLDPVASLELTNKMVEAYKAFARNRFATNRKENLEVTYKRVLQSGADLEKARSQLRAFKEGNGGIDTQAQQGSTSMRVADLEVSVVQARNEVAAGNSADSVAGDNRLESLRQQILEARLRYQDIVRDFLPDSERARIAENRLSRLIAQAEARTSEIKASNARRLSQIESSLQSARSRAASLPAQEQTLAQLNERVESLQTVYRITSDRYNQLNLARSTVPPSARTLQSASISSSRSTQWVRAMAVSLIAALGLGLVGAWLANRLDRSVRTISDPDELFDVPVLGVMPATGRNSATQLSGMITKRGRSALQNATIEACYTTQNNLLAAARSLDVRSILITSAVPGEGKSQCASNLATAMAYGGQSVLLLDADFLHPSQHLTLKMSLEPGYMQVLQGKIALTEAVRPTSVPNLSLLSAGASALDNPADMVALLSGAAHQRNLKELAKFYDVVLIDGPPTMSMADAQLLSNMAESMVLVAAEKTHQEEVYRARSMLRLAGGMLLGVVVNSVSLREMGNWNLNTPGDAPFSNYVNTLRQRNH